MPHKKIHLEFLRILAIILVVFNHTPAFHFPITAPVDVSWTEFLMLAASIADKVAVPLFFMISGALLLPKKESLIILLKHRVLRMVIVLFTYLIAYNSIYFFAGRLTSKQVILNLLRGSAPAPTTWFLYGYLSFLLMLPFLRMLAEKMHTRHFIYLLVLHFVFVEFIPLPRTPLDAWLPFTAHRLTLSNIYLYAMLGYYLENRVLLRRITAKVLIGHSLASIFSILIGATLTILPLLILNYPPSPCSCCFSGSVLIPCIFLYMFFRKLGTHSFPLWLRNIITLLGSATFTVMLTENIFRDVISRYVPDYGTLYYPSIFVTLMVCICGWTCGIIAKRIPFVKTLV